MNSASQNFPHHLAELRERMLHPTDYEKAVHYFLRAARRSAAESAMAEAEAHLTRGLTLAAEMTNQSDRDLSRAELMLALASVKMAVQGYGSREHGAAVSELARETRWSICRVACAIRLHAFQHRQHPRRRLPDA